MDASAQLLRMGENGATELVTTSAGLPHGDAVNGHLVDLFFSLVRDLPNERLIELVDTVIASGSQDAVADLFVLAFQTRNCRGGKGEKALSYRLLAALYSKYPDTLLACLHLLPRYGYYKDFCLLLEFLSSDSNTIQCDFQPLEKAVVELIATQLEADKAELDRAMAAQQQPGLSLMAKYAPREHTHFATGANKRHFKSLVARLFPSPSPSPCPSSATTTASTSTSTSNPKKAYRRLISDLSKALDVTELKMCSQRYAEIDFAKVPSLCANRFRKAFLNELCSHPRFQSTSSHFNKRIAAAGPMTPEQQVTGNRFPDVEDRVKCRQNLRTALLEEKSIKGKQLMPHELVHQLFSTQVYGLELELYKAQWDRVKEAVLEQCSKKATKDKEEEEKEEEKVGGQGSASSVNVGGVAVDLGKVVPLCDVSGSMSGEPMEVCIALGMLVSELNHPAFRDRVITFETSPTWVNLAGCTDLQQKVETLKRAPWGGSTNFMAAIEMILEVVVKNSLPATDIPDLLVFSDMQFDQAGPFGLTHYELMKKKFAEAGHRICGAPYELPRIIFWNLRGDTRGYPCAADAPNVQMLSGFSPSLLKLLLDGEPLPTDEAEEVDVEEEEEDEEGMVVLVKKQKQKTSPFETLRRVLDDEQYHPVREVLSRSSEHQLAGFTFVGPSSTSAA
jgi:hypothetical protein